MACKSAFKQSHADIISLKIMSDVISVLTQATTNLCSNHIKIQQHQNTQHDTVPAENLEIMLFDISHEEGNHTHGHYKSHHHADNQKRRFGHAEAEPEFHQLQKACAEHDRDSKEK